VTVEPDGPLKRFVAHSSDGEGFIEFVRPGKRRRTLVTVRADDGSEGQAVLEMILLTAGKAYKAGGQSSLRCISMYATLDPAPRS
jgi:hypothetical protein